MASDKDFIECKDWAQFYPTPRKTVAPYWAIGAVVLVVIAVVGALYSSKVYAEPFAVTHGDGIVVTLHTEKCAMPEVTNLPQRATWEEKGKVFEGCAGVNRDLGVVLFYFSDKTVGAAPIQAFQRVTGA